VLNNYFVCGDYMLRTKTFWNSLKDSVFSFTKVCALKKIFLENFSISENNVISVEAVKVLWYSHLPKLHLDGSDLYIDR